MIILLTNANFEGTILSFIPINNSFNDFTSDWYRASGSSLVSTMLYGAFAPFIQFIFAFVMKHVQRIFDQGVLLFDNSAKITKKLSIQAYIDLYSGPHVVIHFRYASLLNQIYVTFMYGLVLPILFPICLLSIFIQYVVEKMQFAYFYRQPPHFDNRQNDRALGILLYAPVIMMVFGYW